MKNNTRSIYLGQYTRVDDDVAERVLRYIIALGGVVDAYLMPSLSLQLTKPDGHPYEEGGLAPAPLGRFTSKASLYDLRDALGESVIEACPPVDIQAIDANLQNELPKLETEDDPCVEDEERHAQRRAAAEDRMSQLPPIQKGWVRIQYDSVAAARKAEWLNKKGRHPAMSSVI